MIDFRTNPSRYKHWKLTFDGPVATIAMDVKEDGGLKPGYALKLNSYDLGVDIELYDAIQRLRFELAANSFARSATLASNLLFGTISSTSRHATARLPLMPSSMVQK